MLLEYSHNVFNRLFLAQFKLHEIHQNKSARIIIFLFTQNNLLDHQFSHFQGMDGNSHHSERMLD